MILQKNFYFNTNEERLKKIEEIREFLNTDNVEVVTIFPLNGIENEFCGYAVMYKTYP